MKCPRSSRILMSWWMILCPWQLCWTDLDHAPAIFAYAIDNDYDEYVKEVLEEDAWHHDQDNPYYEDPPPNSKTNNNSDAEKEQERLRRKHEEERLKQQAEAERRQRQKAEEAFAREMAALPEEQQKLLRQKRRRDGKIVQRILNATHRKDYYAVLGLRWFFPEGIRLIHGRGGKSEPPSKKSKSKSNKFAVIKDVVLKLSWPDVIILRLSTRDIQQAYRTRAVQVHPDKNRDPRTEQAFVAVQEAHAILSDVRLRQEYEQERRQHRLAVRQAWKDRFHKLVNTTLRPVWVVVHKVLGPMTVPIVVLVALLF